MDMGSISGQSDLEGRVFADAGFRSWLGLSTDLRYGIRNSGSGTLGWGAPAHFINTPLANAPITWEPGNYWSFRIVPRLRITEGLDFMADYRSATAKAGKYTLDQETAAIIPDGERYPLPDISFLAARSAASQQRIGLGLTYSTLPQRSRTGKGLPFMIRGRADKAIGGNGGLTPESVQFTAEIKLFWKLWGS